jgi:hypothetical protein
MIYVLIIMFQRMDLMQLPCKTTTDFKHWVASTCPETPPLESREPFEAFATKAACELARAKVKSPHNLSIGLVGCVRVKARMPEAK